MQYNFNKLIARAKTKEAKRCFLDIESQDIAYAYEVCIEKAKEKGIDIKICNRLKTIKI